jgi:hypothetical protein
MDGIVCYAKHAGEIYVASKDISSQKTIFEKVPPSIVVSDKVDTVDGTFSKDSEHSKRRFKKPVRFDDFVL